MTTYEAPISPAQSSIIDDDDDDSHKCRRCDLPILEGHAYELGGDRWHMYCFSCSKCSKLLGTSSNFLVLGTGDLICSDCSYACNACGKKIDDLAILTGDQAYCSTCFCCRNCKKRIEDLKYARTSKGLFCMSCHEKLLEKKRRHDNEKRLKQRQSKLPNPEKVLPQVPQEDGQRASSDYLRALSPAETDISEVSTPGATEVATSVTAPFDTDVPPRSPERVPVQPLPKNMNNSRLLEPPVAVSPMKFPPHLSPMMSQEDFDITAYNDTTDTVQNEHHVTPKNQDLRASTPDRLNSKSPLRNAILTPNAKNRQAMVVGDISSSSSNNILSSYTNESPPPKIPPPKLPDDDFIDMNDSDDDAASKYANRPPGFSEIRHSEMVPTGLNIQGLPSFDEHFEKDEQNQKNQISPDNYETGNLSPDLGNDIPLVVKHQRSFSANTTEGIPLENDHDHGVIGSAKSWKSALMSPTAPSAGNSAKKGENGLQKSKSIRSPKNFLNFRKHKKSVSQTSVENYRISSPLMESRTGFDEQPNISVHTPKIGQDSPYHGAALFTTPPVPDSDLLGPKRKQSMHARSRSDANVESNELAHAELELRSLRTEIRDLKLTKTTVMREVQELTAQRDEMNAEVNQLQARLYQLKMQLQGQSSKSSLDDINETTPLTSNSQQHPYSSSTTQSGSAPAPPPSAGAAGLSPTVAIAETVTVDTSKQPKSKARFWKRFGGKADGISSSQSSYSISHLLNDPKGGNPQISAPIMRSDEADELGGNDNKKLLNARGHNLETLNGNGSSGSGTSIVTNGSSNPLIMSDLFNSSLEMRATYEKRPVPLIVSRLVSEIEKKGLDSEGIYRKNGATSQMNAILKAFNNLYQADTSQELENSLNNCDINAVTSALKRYLYFHLPEPVIPMHTYEHFINISKLDDDLDKIDGLANVVSSLPKVNARTLSLMLTHLKKVETYSHLNKMSYHNLAVVFAPTLARVSDGERELMDMASRNNVTEFLLRNQDAVFARVEQS
ncbi:CYFA0S01e09824g1_1 [Cyberlindnera fabianii]|uniref:CYFA0S01e09824g1_1 n=1 Tax=Cyberlindnera fabianii TaxID=36022 RepID=A0A061APP6_CYBFA|nr:CYFA0S01e09824g1_1 [Cyberlindnera fabianii]